jgi:hypothetical protein
MAGLAAMLRIATVTLRTRLRRLGLLARIQPTPLRWHRTHRSGLSALSPAGRFRAPRPVAGTMQFSLDLRPA